MTPQTPHLRLPTLQPSSPAFSVPASRALHSSPLRQPLTPVLAPHQDSIPDLNSSSASAARNHQRPSGDNYLRSPSALNQASNHVLSPTPSHRSMPGFADDVYSMLTDLTGAVSLLHEEWSKTQNSFSAMNIPAVSVSRGYPKVVHDALKPKLGITHDRDIKEATKDHQHMASPEEVDNFDNGVIPAPSLTPFHPYWDEIRETREDVKTHFFQHLLTLKKELKCQTPRSHETEVQATQRAEWQHQITLARGRMQNRQLTLFKSREQICREGFNKSDHAIWEILLQLVLTLGSEGQSSNESEDEPETFSVRCWPWHNEHITELLQFIDSHRETLNNYGNNQSGKSFRKRERKSNPPLTQDRPIMRLPHNLYSNEFLSTRHLDQLCHLDV
ncbi:hypothetical protein H2248_001427 [Termitomyces sp. 'cryptogamus']|nr:hypothetical protein H2248_001427 [Termitomyces sp. 'cryptogamus']